MAFMPSRSKHERNVLSKYKKRRCTLVYSHVNRIKSNILNTSNSDNVIGNSNLPHINVKMAVQLINSLPYRKQQIQIKV